MLTWEAADGDDEFKEKFNHDLIYWKTVTLKSQPTKFWHGNWSYIVSSQTGYELIMKHGMITPIYITFDIAVKL